MEGSGRHGLQRNESESLGEGSQKGGAIGAGACAEPSQIAGVGLARAPQQGTTAALGIRRDG